MTLLDLVGVIPDWVDQAACGTNSSVDPEIFFPHPGQNNEDDNRGTLNICRRCPVNQACAEYAFTQNIEHGIWGGITERKRRKIKRDARAARRKVAS
jgi:hypothetical protein